MKTLKEFLPEDMFSALTNKLVDVMDSADVKKISKMKNVEEMKKYFKSLDRYKKKDVQNVMFRKFNKLPAGNLKKFANFVINQRIS